ncbi:MAG: hypothetical protein COX06_02905 [Candidatus Zambryskibacteria bacterium CG22_combo_CG10-13_8_21_14_all_42_17]|uniref:Uncharacterized protein n=1 Tax=Candidatus Zambryskibacteria bacterium CG22_combo_CG10-13_8_21_14_all_42_17 TaxID=1975118 RepID=A0A2H0BEW1_9BACT|nr:MAG: hypothetical protein COX06_02905 [Candidatus Zambryskibacteria bacterium CG22_combo_CG10-13_8_21_14_all_42_17]PIR57506.1 MAG: hypothetical protein COU72_00580 [Parcubacteria group bacterium CG10_big_fil_rev_8_21_14_0_10_41_35]
MREVIVTAGTRATGKSTFCDKALALDPSMIEISRDKILLELFGKTALNPYYNGFFYVKEKIWENAKKALVPQDVKMIFDVWNGDSLDRKLILRKLREYGADRVVAWYFITPIEIVEEWFWKKPCIAKIGAHRSQQGENITFYPEDAPQRDHELFHKLASDIDSDGFDEVVRINPVTMGPEHVLRFQTSLEL